MGYSAFRRTGLTHHHPQRSFKGYTVITPLGGNSTYVLDMGGRIVHRWRFDDIKPSYARLLDNGNLAVLAVDKKFLLEGARPPGAELPVELKARVRGFGGNATVLREVSWDGETLWEHENETQHHDFVRLPNGNTVLADWVDIPEELERQVRGGQRSRSRNRPPMSGDEIYEIDPSGKEVWRARLWELHDPRRDPICPLEDRREWTHVNSLDVNGDGDVLFSCRNNSRVGIINRSSGELTWSYGQPETFHQHHATWLDNGNVQIFDNGMHRIGMPRSRVIEVNPKTSEIVWEYKASPDIQFLSAHISGAQRLPNGNVLVCEGAPGRLFEITREGEIVWEWVNPIVEQLRDAPSSAIFRAHRYGPDHPAFADRSLEPRRHMELNRLHGLGGFGGPGGSRFRDSRFGG